MAIDFQYFGYHWTIRAGFPPMGSRERTDPLFVDALKVAFPRLRKFTEHELGSWIVARLFFLTAGTLTSEGTEFAHDTNEIGYKLKISDDSKTSLAHGAVVIHAKGVHFASVDLKIDDFQAVVVRLLTESTDDLSQCEIRVREPETRNVRKYGWDGYSLFH